MTKNVDMDHNARQAFAKLKLELTIPNILALHDPNAEITVFANISISQAGCNPVAETQRPIAPSYSSLMFYDRR